MTWMPSQTSGCPPGLIMLQVQHNQYTNTTLVHSSDCTAHVACATVAGHFRWCTAAPVGCIQLCLQRQTVCKAGAPSASTVVMHLQAGRMAAILCCHPHKAAATHAKLLPPTRSCCHPHEAELHVICALYCMLTPSLNLNHSVYLSRVEFAAHTLCQCLQSDCTN